MNDCLKREVTYKTSRSSGPGGQHVNRTESRVTLFWNLEFSSCLNDFQKGLIRTRLGSRFTDGGVLIISSENSRSQYQNREDVTTRFLEIIAFGLKPVKRRKPTKPSRASKERRIRDKKTRGEQKRLRRGNVDE